MKRAKNWLVEMQRMKWCIYRIYSENKERKKKYANRIMMALANTDEQNSGAIDTILLAIDDLYKMLEPVLLKGGE